jgi:hypothetical protein
MMSSSGVTKLIGRGVYNTFRKAAKIPVDIDRHLLHGENTVLKGSVYDRVEGEIGEEAFKELCQDDALVLETIFYCQEELHSLGKSLQASRKLLNSSFDENEQVLHAHNLGVINCCCFLTLLASSFRKFS